MLPAPSQAGRERGDRIRRPARAAQGKGKRLTRLAVIIVNYRTPDLALACARAAADAAPGFAALDVLIVDGGSGDGSAERIAAALGEAPAPAVRLLALDINGGFGFANNRGMRDIAAAAPLPDYFVLLNPDARPRPGALEAMARLLDATPRAGAVGARLEHEDGRPQSSAFTFPTLRGEFARATETRFVERLLGVPPTAIDADAAREVPWVTGAAVMFRAAALVQTGLFDEGFFLYFEETDLIRRLRAAGWSIWHEPQARVVHHGGVATGIRDTATGSMAPRQVPRYWLDSRRRYFALAGGRGYALASGLCWLAGRMIWLGKRLIVPKRNASPPQLTADFVRYGLVPTARDASPAIVTFTGDIAEMPAWMTARVTR